MEIVQSGVDGHPHPNPPNDSQPGDGKRNKHRKVPKAPIFFIAALWLAALAVAVGQHFFYSSLNGSELQSSSIPQSWVAPLGTAFAFIFKSLIVGSVAIIYAQALWFCVQRHAIQAESLDGLFGVLDNPLQFFNKDLFQRTPFLFFVAVVSWSIPLSAVIAPGALTSS